VYGLQAVGLDGRRTPHTDLAEMAAEYVNEITRLRPHGPYHLTGLSFGGLVAFEMACQLTEQGQRVGLVAILDAGRPGHLQSSTRAEQLDNYARRFRYHVTNLVLGPDRIRYIRRKTVTLRRRARDRFWGLIARPFRAPGQTLPPALHRVAEANWTAYRSYTPRRYSGQLTLFIASQREITMHRLLDLGWGPYADGGVDTYEAPGDHSNLVSEPYVGALAEQMRCCLARANDRT
jgi:thioesterase domain-containing protein